MTSPGARANAVSREHDEPRAMLIRDVGPGPWEEIQCHHNEVLEHSIEPWKSLPKREENEGGDDYGLTFQVPPPPAAVLQWPVWSRLQYVPLMLPSDCTVP